MNLTCLHLGKSLLLKEGCIREADIIERACKNEAPKEKVEDPLKGKSIGRIHMNASIKNLKNLKAD